MPSDMIESVVANSPLLEELTLEDNKLVTFNKNHVLVDHYKLRIHAPNLECFYFNGYCEEICFYAPLLSKLRVFLTDTCFKDEHLQQESPVCNYYTKFLGGSTNLEELSGGQYFIEYLSIGIESCQRSLVFHHLRLIELCRMSCRDMKLISVFVHLITGAPNLHKLIISCDYYINSKSTIAWDSESAPNFTSGRLKVIEMSNVYGGLHWMRLIKFLLERSPLLEMMILKPYEDRSVEKLLDMMAEVLRFRRASTKAEILFRRR